MSRQNSTRRVEPVGFINVHRILIYLCECGCLGGSMRSLWTGVQEEQARGLGQELML